MKVRIIPTVFSSFVILHFTNILFFGGLDETLEKLLNGEKKETKNQENI